MAKEIPAFLRAEIGNNAADPTQEARDRMLGCLAQMCLELAEGQFDRVEVRRIFREIHQRRARRLDRFKQFQIINGLKPHLLEPALRGEHVGTIVRKE